MPKGAKRANKSILEEVSVRYRCVWQGRRKAVVLTTVASEGVPNSIWAACTAVYEKETVVVAGNYFNKTKQNIQKVRSAIMPRGCISTS